MHAFLTQEKGNGRAPMLEQQIISLVGNRFGVFDAPCPSCGPDRKSPLNRVRKVLRIWRDTDAITSYCCSRCNMTGYIRNSGEAAVTKASTPLLATPVLEASSDKNELARALWKLSQPLDGAIGAQYFAGRALSGLPACSRFLPARGGHPPAIISRFGFDGSVTGVHITRLSPDGAHKAGTDKDKFMLGDSTGQPLIVATSESPWICISEGIENALSIHEATGWEAWAAGSLNRIPMLLPAVAKGARLAIEREFETPRSGVTSVFKKVTDQRPDARILRLYLAAHGKLPSAGYDANKLHQDFGLACLQEAITALMDQQAMAMVADGRAMLV
jgi:hypothetical protein